MVDATGVVGLLDEQQPDNMKNCSENIQPPAVHSAIPGFGLEQGGGSRTT
jgi:hypothetical protein